MDANYSKFRHNFITRRQGAWSGREAEMQHVAIGDEVVLTLEPQPAVVARARLPVIGYIIFIGDGFCAYEALFEIGVDHSGGLRGACAARHRPGPCFLGTGGEKRDEMQEFVAGADYTVEARLRQANGAEIVLLLVG